MTIWEKMQRFADRFGRRVVVNHTTWQYYRLGEKLFGRAVEMVSLGQMGHAAPILHPDKYVELLEEKLA
jgi:hypothetical protein